MQWDVYIYGNIQIQDWMFLCAIEWKNPRCLLHRFMHLSQKQPDVFAISGTFSV